MGPFAAGSEKMARNACVKVCRPSNIPEITLELQNVDKTGPVHFLGRKISSSLSDASSWRHDKQKDSSRSRYTLPTRAASHTQHRDHISLGGPVRAWLFQRCVSRVSRYAALPKPNMRTRACWQVRALLPSSSAGTFGSGPRASGDKALRPSHLGPPDADACMLRPMV